MRGPKRMALRGYACSVAAQTDLGTLLRTMQPELRPGRFVYTTLPVLPDGIAVVASVLEDEGVSVVIEQSLANRLGLRYDYVAAMITLRVHSSLHAVGLTSAVASALADAGISCNVVAGNFHDHLFVPLDRSEQVLSVLHDLASGNT